MKLAEPQGSFRKALLVKNIPEGGILATLTGNVEEGSKEDFYSYYIGFTAEGSDTEQFFGLEPSSMSYGNIIAAFGDESDNWKGKEVHIGTAVMTKGKYAGTACLSVTAR